MEVTGKISKLNNEYGYGFITTKDRKEVFFSPTTSLSNASFGDLELNDTVSVEVENTDRGPFARSLTVARPRKSMTSAEKNQRDMELG